MARCEVKLLEVDNRNKGELRRQMQRLAEIGKEGHTYVLDFARNTQKTAFLVVSAKPYNDSVISTLVQKKPGTREAELEFIRRAQFALLRKAMDEASLRFGGTASQRSFELDIMPPGLTPQKAGGGAIPFTKAGQRAAKQPVMKPPAEGKGATGDLLPPKAPGRRLSSPRIASASGLPSMGGPGEVSTGKMGGHGVPSLQLPVIKKLPEGVSGKGTKESPFMIALDFGARGRGASDMTGTVNRTNTELGTFWWKFSITNFSTSEQTLDQVSGRIADKLYYSLAARGARLDRAALTRDIRKNLEGVWRQASDLLPEPPVIWKEPRGTRSTR